MGNKETKHEHHHHHHSDSGPPSGNAERRSGRDAKLESAYKVCRSIVKLRQLWNGSSLGMVRPTRRSQQRIVGGKDPLYKQF